MRQGIKEKDIEAYKLGLEKAIEIVKSGGIEGGEREWNGKK